MIENIKSQKIVALGICLKIALMAILIFLINFIKQNKIENKFEEEQNMVNYFIKSEKKFDDFTDFFNNNTEIMEINSKKSRLNYNFKNKIVNITYFI